MLFILSSLGCASPGPPHAPSLFIPKFPADLTALRKGDRVDLRFTAPQRSTDNLPLRAATIRVGFCRQIEHRRCVPLASATREVAPSHVGAPSIVTVSDALPPDLATGAARLIGYRIELFNPSGQTVGWSEPAYTAAGQAPPDVADLRAEGTRLGVLLTWQAASGAGSGASKIILERTDLDAKSDVSKHGAAPANGTRLEANGTARTLDTTAKPDVTYRYSAIRTVTAQVGGRGLELRSGDSPAATITLRLAYAPPPPTGLTAAGFVADATPTTPAGYAIDLNWQPVEDTGLLAGLAGYNIYREAIDEVGRATSPRRRLNRMPVQIPAFHDAEAQPSQRYRYSVTAVDAKGNESPAVQVVTTPDTQLPPTTTP
jgi:hypothetical protein